MLVAPKMLFAFIEVKVQTICLYFESFYEGKQLVLQLNVLQLSIAMEVAPPPSHFSSVSLSVISPFTNTR